MKYAHFKKLFVCGLLYFISSFVVAQNITVPTLPAGKKIIIVSSVTINNPFTLAPSQVSKQHTITGTNFSNVVSNDPKTSAIDDPTISLISLFPEVSSINRLSPLTENTNVASVILRVTFSANVSGVDVSDFTLTTTGTTAGTISSVTGPVPGTVYDVTVNGISGDGTLRLDLKSSGTDIVDEGNVPLEGGFNTGQTYTIDQTIPTLSPVTIASNNTNPAYAKVGDLITLSFTSSETINTPIVTINSNAEVATPAGNVYTVQHTMTAGETEGPVSISISNYSDASGNAGLPVTSTTNSSIVTFDKTLPTVSSINRFNPSGPGTNLSSVVFRVIFSEVVSGVDITDFVLTNTGSANGSIASVSATTGSTIDVTVNTIIGTGTMRLDLNSNGTGIKDVASNFIAAGFTTGETYLIDRTAPSVTSIDRNTPPGALTNVTTVIFRVIFSEPVSNVDVTDFELDKTGTVNGSISGISAIDGATYDVTVNSITGDGNLRLDLINSVTGISDNSANALVTGGFNTGQTYTIDHTPPVLSPVTIVSNNTNPVYAKAGDLVTVSFTASETITTPTVSIAGHPIIVPAPAGLVYSLNYTMTSGDAEGVIPFNLSGYTDLAGNLGVAVTTTTNAGSITFDKTIPTITSIGRFNPSGSLTNLSAVVFRVTFSEAVSGVDISDFVLSNTGTASGSIASVSAASGTVIDVTVNNITGVGTIRLDLKNSGTNISDVASNGIAGGFTTGQTYSVDGSAPSVISINRNTPSAALTNATSVLFTITFTEVITGLDAGDLALTKTGTANGSIAGISPVNGSTYDVTVNTISGDGTIRLDLKNTGTGITDAATNAISGGFNSGQIYTIDQTPPVLSPVTIASNNANTSYAKVGNHVTVNLTASETITPPSVTIAGHSIVVPAPVGLVYSPNYIMTSADVEGNVIFNISGYTDAAGNAGVAVTTTTNSSSVTFDKTVPTITSINRLTPSTAQTIPTNLTYRVTFSEAVSGVDIGDFILTKTSSADGTITSVSAATGSVIDVTVTSVSGTGTLRLDLKNSATGIIDVAGNAISGGFTTGEVYTIGVPPAFTFCPGNMTVDIDAGQCTKTLALNATASGSPTPTLTARIGTTIITSPYAFPIGTTQVVVTAANGMGSDATCTYNVTVRDQTPPTLSAVTATPTSLWPPDHRMKDVTLTYTSTDNCGSVTNTVTVTSNEADHGTSDGDKGPDWEIVNDHFIRLRAERGNGKEARVYTITVTSTDLSGNTSVKTTEVRVAHNIVTPASGASYIVGSTVNFSGDFWDKAGNKHTAQWLIDDNTIVKATVTEPTGTKNGKVTGSYKFTAAGVYKLQMNITDQNKVTSYTNTNDDLESIVVIYDPNGGYTYGGGWFTSPAGALKSDPAATGKASYGFSMNYFKNATNPKGESQFEFKVGDFEFNALNFDYLSISGARAQFRGTGKIAGGQSGIAFIMTVTDGALNGTGVDKVRMKIYNKLTNYVYYDTQSGESDANDPKTIVGENSTVFIGGTNGVSSSARMIVGTQSDNIESTNIESTDQVKTTEPVKSVALHAAVSPNPSTTEFTLNISGHILKQVLNVIVYDHYGRVVEERNAFGNTIKVGSQYRPGIYYLKIKQGKTQLQFKLVKL